MGSAPAAGAVFRALAENLERKEKFQLCGPLARPTAGYEGVSSHARGRACSSTPDFGFILDQLEKKTSRWVTKRTCGQMGIALVLLLVLE